MSHSYSDVHSTKINHTIASDGMVKSGGALTSSAGIQKLVKACTIQTQGCNYPLLSFNKLVTINLIKVLNILVPILYFISFYSTQW